MHKKIKIYTLSLLVIFGMLFTPLSASASQNNTRTEDQQQVTLSIVKSSNQLSPDGKLPQTGEAKTVKYMIQGIILLTLLILIIFIRKKWRGANED